MAVALSARVSTTRQPQPQTLEQPRRRRHDSVAPRPSTVMTAIAAPPSSAPGASDSETGQPWPPWPGCCSPLRIV